MSNIDPVKFARLVSYLTHANNGELGSVAIQTVHDYCSNLTSDLPQRTSGLMPEKEVVYMLVAMADGHLIDAIKTLRNSTNLGLKEAKDLIEHARMKTA